MDLSKTLGGVLSLHEGDKLWQFSPHSLQDLLELEEWCKDQIFALAMKNSGLISDPKERKEFREYALSFTISLNLQNLGVLTSVMNSVPGSARMIYLSLRHRHPDVQMEDALRLASTPEYEEMIDQILTELNNPGGELPKQKTPSPRRQTGGFSSGKSRRKRGGHSRRSDN